MDHREKYIVRHAIDGRCWTGAGWGPLHAARRYRPHELPEELPAGRRSRDYPVIWAADCGAVQAVAERICECRKCGK